MSKPPSHFEPIENLELAYRFISDGAKSIAPTLIWTKEKGLQFESHITLLSTVDHSLTFWCPKDLDRKRFLDELVQKQNNDCFFSMSLSQATIFFKTSFVEFGDTFLRFGIPTKVFKVQRRKNYRHILFKDPKGWVEFRDPLFPDNILKRKIYDISAGGLSFIVPQSESALFPAGLIIDELKFKANDQEIVVAAEVQHTKPGKGDLKDKGSKVGVSFKRITPANSEFLASYVFDESRKMFSRFM